MGRQEFLSFGQKTVPAPSPVSEPTPVRPYEGRPIRLDGDGYVGAFEAIDYGGIRGWVYRPDSIDHAHLPVEITALIGDEIPVRGMTDLPRPDVMQGGGNAPLNTGFMLPLPRLDLDRFPDPLPVTLIVFALGHPRARIPLRVPLDVLRASQCFAHVGMQGLRLDGWWVDKQISNWSASHSSIFVENALGESHEVQSEQHQAVSNDLSAPAFYFGHDLPAAFVVDALPLKFRSDTSGGRQYLAEHLAPDILYTADVDDAVVRGWAINPHEPLRRPEVVVRVPAEKAVRTIATRATMPIAEMAFPGRFDGFCGFEVGLDHRKSWALAGVQASRGRVTIDVQRAPDPVD